MQPGTADRGRQIVAQHQAVEQNLHNRCRNPGRTRCTDGHAHLAVPEHQARHHAGDRALAADHLVRIAGPRAEQHHLVVQQDTRPGQNHTGMIVV